MSDGHLVAKVTIYEEFSQKIKEGGSYMVRGLSLRGQSPPYQISVSKDTLFFRSAPIALSAELKRSAEALIHPPSPLTQISSCRDAKGMVTVEGEVVQKYPWGEMSFPCAILRCSRGKHRCRCVSGGRLQCGNYRSGPTLKCPTSRPESRPTESGSNPQITPPWRRSAQRTTWVPLG